MTSLSSARPPILLVPGAWMGGWIWHTTITALRERGCTAETLTLPGLGPDAEPADLASIALSDHVDAATLALERLGTPATIVGHSYSGLIAGMVADRLPDLVRRTVVITGFFPRTGRALIDDWGEDDADRAAERATIEDAGMIWAPPPAEGVHADPGLSASEATWLADRLQPHPGRTILEPVVMQRPITDQSVTVMSEAPPDQWRSTLPSDLAAHPLDGWDHVQIPAGHWPMISSLDRVVQALTAVSENG